MHTGVRAERRTADILGEDEVEQLDEGILLLVEEDVGDTGVRFFQKPRLQLRDALGQRTARKTDKSVKSNHQVD